MNATFTPSKSFWNRSETFKYLTNSTVNSDNNEYGNTTIFRNNSEFDNYTDYEYEDWDSSGIAFMAIALMFLYISGSVFSVSTLLLGVLTWIQVPKWRSFKNYVYMCVIFCYTTSMCLLICLIFCDDGEYLSMVIFYLINAFTCWLLIASILIYKDIVVVFNNEVTRKMLKCNVFAWGVPLALSALQMLGKYTEFELLEYVIRDRFIFAGLVLVINFCLYVKVLCKLLESSGMRVSVRFRRKAQVATFTFVMSGGPVLLGTVLSLPVNYIYEYGFFVPAAMPAVQTIIMNVCFLMRKTNRVLWRIRIRNT